MGNKVISVVTAGLGGQGVITASDILAEAAFRAGHDVKKSELHGMSQRGGSVSSDVRFGQAILSPAFPKSVRTSEMPDGAGGLEGSGRPSKGLQRKGAPVAGASRSTLLTALSPSKGERSAELATAPRDESERILARPVGRVLERHRGEAPVEDSVSQGQSALRNTVFSPMIPPGEADFLVVLAPDQVEPNRGRLRPGGVLIAPDAVNESALQNRRSLNVALLGALSAHLPEIPEKDFLDALLAILPVKLHEANKQAFAIGRKAVIAG